MHLLKNLLSKFKIFFVKASFLVKVLIIVGIVLVSGFTIYKITNNGNQNITYQTEQAAKGTLISSVNASGVISAGNTVNITTGASGVVTKVYVKNGDTVTKGEKIADIELDQNAQQRQTQSWASYLSAQNNLNTSQAKLNSLQSTLFKANQSFINDRGIINPSDTQKSDPVYIEENATWLQAEADYKNQTGQIAQTQAAFTNAWVSYQQISPTITAASDGVVTNINLAEGLPIADSNNSSSSNSNSLNTQIVGTITVGERKLLSTVNLSEIDVTKVTVGQKVTLTLDAFADKTFTGKVAAINTNGSVSSGVTTYPATIVFDTTLDNIYPNMGVTAKIITLVKDNVLLISSGAVQTQSGQSTVQIMKNGKTQTVDVTIGSSSDTQTEIVSGLSDGDTVVTGSTTSTTTSTGTASPFGAIGGIRGFGGGGGGAGGGGATRGGGGTRGQ